MKFGNVKNRESTGKSEQNNNKPQRWRAWTLNVVFESSSSSQRGFGIWRFALIEQGYCEEWNYIK
jgi:hypothetical protein